MSPRELRRRAPGLEGFRELTDPEAQALLSSDCTRTVNEAVEWTAAGGESRFSVQVFNTRSETLTLRGRINEAVPHRSHWLLVWGDKRRQEHAVVLRRLDLRDDHDNPDGQAWRGETHKHTWSQDEDNAWAYTPDDIPHDPDPGPVGADDYRAIFEAFVAECGVGFGPDYCWTDPKLDGDELGTLWRVP